MFSFFEDEDDSDDIRRHFEKSNILKIDANADGSCFLHSVFKCSYPEYQKCTKERERRKLVCEFRHELMYMLQTPNQNFPTLESVVYFVKKTFLGNEKGNSKEKKGAKFLEFLKCAYNFEYDYPVQMKEYSKDYFDSMQEYYLYFIKYREYLLKYDTFLNGTNSEIPKFEDVSRKKGNRETIELTSLSEEIETFLKNLKNGHSHLCKIINEQFYHLKKKLQTELGHELYNPQNFGVPYIQAHLNHQPLPEGMYSKLPWNCYFFTANSGVLTRFAYYKEGLIPKLEELNEILANFREFLGDSDIIPFIPGMLNLNVIVIDFYRNQLINEYSSEETKDNPWIVICNSNNAHFDACAIELDEDTIQTLFSREHPFIQCILRSKENKGKIIWDFSL